MSRGHEVTRELKCQTVQGIVERCDEVGDCLIWRGYRLRGVPYVSHHGKMTSVRRLLVDLLHNPPRDKDAHTRAMAAGQWGTTCGDRGCVSPRHLVYRSRSEHAAMMQARLKEYPSAEKLRRAKISSTKERKGLSKLDAAKRAEILASSESGQDIARRLGVSKSAVSKVRTRNGGALLRLASPWAALLPAD